MPQVLRSALHLAICCPVPECEKLNRQLLTGTGRELPTHAQIFRLVSWPSWGDSAAVLVPCLLRPAGQWVHCHLQCVSCHVVVTTIGIQALCACGSIYISKAMLQPLRLRAAQQQILTLALQLGQQVEAPRIVCQAVSLTSALGLPFGSSFAPPSWRHAASKADASRADASRAEPGRSESSSADVPMAAHVVHERQGERPPDIISRALAKGPPELPFPAKAFYLGGLLQAFFTSRGCTGQCNVCRADAHVAMLRWSSGVRAHGAGSKIDIAALRRRAQRDNFPTQFTSAKTTVRSSACGRATASQSTSTSRWAASRSMPHAYRRAYCQDMLSAMASRDH